MVTIMTDRTTIIQNRYIELRTKYKFSHEVADGLIDDEFSNEHGVSVRAPVDDLYACVAYVRAGNERELVGYEFVQASGKRMQALLTKDGRAALDWLYAQRSKTTAEKKLSFFKRFPSQSGVRLVRMGEISTVELRTEYDLERFRQQCLTDLRKKYKHRDVESLCLLTKPHTLRGLQRKRSST